MRSGLFDHVKVVTCFDLSALKLNPLDGGNVDVATESGTSDCLDVRPRVEMS